MEQELRLLIVEDVAAEAELTVHQLRREGLRCTWTRVETEEAFRTALLEQRPHLVLSDFTLPGYDGSAALSLVHGPSRRCGAPRAVHDAANLGRRWRFVRTVAVFMHSPPRDPREAAV